MKFIFDFDGVLFKSKGHFRDHMFKALESAGLPLDTIDKHYEETRIDKFALKHLIKHFKLNENLYEEIMRDCYKFANTELLEIVKKLGKENCFIVSFGDTEFQLDKIKGIEIEPLFKEIHVVPESKKSIVEKIAAQFPTDKVLFIDDKASHFKDLDPIKYPNLKNILFDENGLEKVKEEIKKTII